MKLLLTLALLATLAQGASQDGKPSAEELKRGSDLIAILQIESIERKTMHGGSAILIGTSWYIVQARVVTVFQGKILPESKVIEVIFGANEDAMVLGYAPNPRRPIAAVSEFLVRPPLLNGKRSSQSVEILAFLKDGTHERENSKQFPPMFVPTSGLEHAESSLRILRSPKWRVGSKQKANNPLNRSGGWGRNFLLKHRWPPLG